MRSVRRGQLSAQPTAAKRGAQEHTDIDNNLYVITRSKDGKALWVVGQWGVVLRRKLEAQERMSMR